METINLKEFFTKNYSIEILDTDKQAILQSVKDARKNIPSDKLPLKEDNVPELDQIIPMGCLRCSYTKTVNHVVDDYWDHPYVQQGLSDGSCGDCGAYVKSYTIVVNQKVSKDVVECWELKNR